MVKAITLWKQTFYKNDDANGGAMKHAIAKAELGTVIAHTQTKKTGRAWGAIQPTKFIDLACKNHGLYEVITSFPHKVYFDIDKHCKAEPEFLEKIKAIITEYFDNPVFAISGSYTETKTSFHIILSNYLIHNEEDRAYMKHLCKYLMQRDDSFDWKVYTTNRNMKCINQSKDDGRVQEIIENPNLKAHMITCFLPQFPLEFKQPPMEIQEHIKIETSKK
jgi:hypothetical protein